MLPVPRIACVGFLDRQERQGAGFPCVSQDALQRRLGMVGAMDGIKIDSHGFEAGHRIYTPLMLRTYDRFVLGFSNRWLWRCPTAELLQLYQRNVGKRHLDIGVGTGYFLDKVEWPVAVPDITLLDLNRNCLDAASARIARFKPQSVLANALELLPSMAPFDSIGLCYLFHCLPGSLAQKAVLFDNLKPVVKAGSRLFGASIVQDAGRQGFATRKVLSVYNRKGIFSNVGDTSEILRFELNKRFDRATVCSIGSVALFEVTV